MIYTVDNNVRIIYPSNSSENIIQTLIADLKTLDYTKINNLYFDNDDIAISLVFYFKELIEKANNTELNFNIYVKQRVFDLLTKNFKEVFNSNNLKVQL